MVKGAVRPLWGALGGPVRALRSLGFRRGGSFESEGCFGKLGAGERPRKETESGQS